MKRPKFLDEDLPREKVPDEVFQDLVDTSLDIADKAIAEMYAIAQVTDLYPPEVWEERVEEVMEEHRKRVARLTMWRCLKETGIPF